jgi:hypothetical protein
MVRGRELTIAHLIEASATVLELLNLVAVHGWKAAAYYYDSVVRHRTRVYRDVFDIVTEYTSDWTEALELTHFVVTASLYDDSDPLGAFSSLIEHSHSSGQLRHNALEKRSQLFKKEADLATRIGKMTPRAGVEVLDLSVLSGTPLANLMSLPNTMLTVRSQLLKKCVSDWNWVLSPYLEQTEKLPIPPTIFFPKKFADNAVSALKYSDLLGDSDPHIIAGKKNEIGDWQFVAAAFVPTFRNAPCVDPIVSDLMMLMSFVWIRLTKGTKNVYGNIVDVMYEGIFEKLYLDEN